MKNKQILIISAFCMLLCACGTRYTNHNVILRAESLLNEHPDSAYKLLSSITNPEQLPKPDYAAWCLHYTHARYKLYMDINSDSLIKIAVDYYANSKLHKYSGTSYYLLGCVSELLLNKDEAILSYKKASIALENSEEYNTLGLVNFNMGYIYRLDKNFYQANICYKKSFELFNISGNKKHQISSCVEIADMLLRLEYPLDSVIFYSNKSLKLSEEIGDDLMKYRIICRQGELLCDKNNRIAINKLLAGFSHCADLRSRSASFLAYLYSEINKPDSASFYLQRASEQKVERELEVLKDLANSAVSEKNGDFRKAYYSFENAYLIQDTIFREKLKSQLYRIDKQFDLSEKEKENAVLKIANRTKIIWIAVLIIFVLLILVVLQRVNIHHKKRKAEMELKQQKTEFELKEKELVNNKKKELLLSKLQQRMDMTVRFNKLQQSFHEPHKQADFIELMTNQTILTKTEWENYIKEANSIFDNKIDYLSKTYQELTETDLIVIVLIALGLDISDSCVLLNMSKETMYKRRKRIKARLNIEVDLEEWINQNIL